MVEKNNGKVRGFARCERLNWLEVKTRKKLDVLIKAKKLNW